MATMVNGCRIEQSGYEFAVLMPGAKTPIKYPSYNMAKEAQGIYGGKIRMRAIYRTGWMDAK